MSEKMICDKTSECKMLSCWHRKPHGTVKEHGMADCCRDGFVGCIAGSKCVPVASHDGTATNSQPETERGTSDPDAVLARGYALIHQTRVWLLDEQYSVGELLLRLSDKVEGK